MLKLVLWVVCFAMGSAAFAVPPNGVVKVEAEWTMSLDANGAITALEAKPGRIKEVLRKVLETAVRGWKFEPGSINGTPAATETNLIVSISLWPMPGGESYSVKVESVQTGSGVAKFGRMPSFSQAQAERARRDKINPMVILELTFDENGKAGEVFLADQSPVIEGPLVKQAIKAVRTWTFKPERVAGHGVPGRALIPICYVASGSDCTYPESKNGAPFEPGSSIALESRVSLKSDVIGKTL